MTQTLDLTQNPKQALAWHYLTDKETRELGYGGAAGGGKSYLGVAWLIVMCLKYPGTRWLLGRRTLTDLETTTLVTFWKCLKAFGVERENVHVDGKHHVLTFPKVQTGQTEEGKPIYRQSQIIMRDLAYKPTDPLFTRLGGLELTGAFIDEANECHPSAIEIVRSRCGRCLNGIYGLVGKVLLTFNPDKGFIYLNFYQAAKKGVLPIWRKFIKALATDNKANPDQKGYIEGLKTLSKVQRERLLEGNFEFDDDPSVLFDIETIGDLWTNTAVKSTDKYLIVDAARLGGDKIVCGYFEGLNLVKVYWWEKARTNESADKIKEIAAKKQVGHSNILIDEDGVGGGIVDQISGAKGFLNNGTPIQSRKQEKVANKQTKGTLTQNYGNLKAQCWFKLQELALKKQFQISETDEYVNGMILEDLQYIKEKISKKDSKIYIISKEEIKDLLGRSTDFGDILMMRMFFELRPPTKFAAFDV